MIKDVEKNGICCEDGEGSWSVRLDGKFLFFWKLYRHTYLILSYGYSMFNILSLDDTINTSSFEDGRKEIVMINCDDME